MRPIIFGGFVFSAIAFGLYNMTRPHELGSKTLKTIRMENEQFLKLLEIMHDIKHNGLKQAVGKHVAKDKVDDFIDKTLFENFTKSNTRLCECKVSSIFFKAATHIFEIKYDAAIKHTPFYYQSADQHFHVLISNKLLSIIKHHTDKYKALFEGDEPVVSSSFFWGNLDYKKLADLVRDPEQKLAISLSCDDYTTIERLYIQNEFELEFRNLTTSQFKKDLLDFHHYFYNKNDSTLIDEIYDTV